VLENKTAILVNRGFVPWYGQRGKVADITVNENRATIQVELIKPKMRLKFKTQK
jgi:surfeit locus 1 family protein